MLTYWGRTVHTTSIKKNEEALVVATKETELEVVSEKLSAWSSHEIRMQDEVTV
jgi:transcriptional antiterminator Rof (Rho-off)